MCGAPIHGIHAVGDIDEADDGDGSNENDGGKAGAERPWLCKDF